MTSTKGKLKNQISGNVLHGEEIRYEEKPRVGISLAKIKKDRLV